MMLNNSPYFRKPASVRSVMLRVLVALLPGIAAYVWFFGAAILVQIALASIAALVGEAAFLSVREKPVWLFVSDGSALVTGWLIALSLPPIAPWWMVVVATLFGIVIVKHLYGGLGQNPFNPAMAAFCVMIVAYPQLMSQWPAADLHTSFAAQWQLIFGGGERHLDAVTMATALDTLRTGLHSAESKATVAGIFGSQATFGMFGGKGWEWVATGYLVGGVWMIQQRIITWHIPTAFVVALGLTATLFHFFAPDRYAGAMFHIFAGGAMLGAFFIATDPVSGTTTPKGKLIYGAAIAILDWVIRTYGAYPDGVAFATLLMNIVAPLIDLKTQPPVFGHKNDRMEKS